MVVALIRGLRRHPLVVLNALLVVGLGAAGAWRAVDLTQVVPVPADLFMQSVATEDADLGWRQLCPTLQNELPRDVLEQNTLAQRTLQAQQGVTLTIEHVGDRPRPMGGQVRFYIATARGADGATGQKTYAIRTQPNGCVESIDS